jgi:hypothetical protein
MPVEHSLMMADNPYPLTRAAMALGGREPDRVPVLDLVRSVPDAQVAEDSGRALRTLPGSSICLVTADLTPRYPIRILQQNGDDIVRTTPNGSVARFSRGGVRPPEILYWPLKTRFDWAMLGRRMEVLPERADWVALAAAGDGARAAGLSLAFTALAGFEGCGALTGPRSLFDMLYLDPDLVRDVVETQAGLLTGMVDLLITGGIPLDAVLLFDELAGSRGLQFSLERFRRIVAPVYRRMADFFHSRNMKMILYSGGDLRVLIPELLQAGLDCIGPLEVEAGMDLPVLKLNYGADLAFLGGIDRRALFHPDPAVLEREIAVKVRAGRIHARYIAGFDGPLPADMPEERYARAAELLAEYGRY